MMLDPISRTKDWLLRHVLAVIALSFMASLVCLVLMPSSVATFSERLDFCAFAANGDASTNELIGYESTDLSTQSEGTTLFLGSPDGKTYNAKVIVTNVTSGTATFVANSTGNGGTVVLNGIVADTVSIHSDASDRLDKVYVKLVGDNVLSGGICTVGQITESLTGSCAQ